MVRPEPFAILAVCDGNVCRSASAEYQLGTRLPGVRIESAGLRTRSDMQLCDLVAREISVDGASASEFADAFRSRRIGAVDVGEFALVLAATTGLRSELARAHPELRDRFFTFREAADILVAVRTAARAERDGLSIVELMNRYRGAPPTAQVPPELRRRMVDPLDIPDAHGDRARRHRAVVRLARQSSQSIAESLGALGV